MKAVQACLTFYIHESTRWVKMLFSSVSQGGVKSTDMPGNMLMFNRIFGESILNICGPLFCFSEWKRVSKFQHWPAQAACRKDSHESSYHKGKVGMSGL